MQIIPQIVLGSFVLIVSLTVQLGTSMWTVRKLRATLSFDKEGSLRSYVLFMTIVFLPLLFAHTVHIYTWAFFIWLLGALPGYEEPIYFALVTYTTVGYGDVVLPKDFRVFGGMASVNGILSFGLSTAFLAGIFAKVLKLRGDR